MDTSLNQNTTEKEFSYKDHKIILSIKLIRHFKCEQEGLNNFGHENATTNHYNGTSEVNIETLSSSTVG
jgi:hypothetical protein